MVQYADDSGPGFTTTGGRWIAEASGEIGTQRAFKANQTTYAPNSGNGVAQWTFNVTPGFYQVSATWPTASKQATNAKFSVLDGKSVESTVTVDQRYSVADFADTNINDARWENLGNPVDIAGNTLVVQLSSQANGPVVADGIRIQRVSSLIFHGQGPVSTAQFRNLEGKQNPGLPYVGAVQAAVPDPGDADRMWIATVSGGIWRTDDATAPSPTWVPQTDQAGSLSMSALVLDPTDASDQTLVAAFGRVSSYGGEGGALTGLLKTADGGTTWLPIGQNHLQGLTIRSIVARGNLIVVAAVATNILNYGPLDGGVFVSADGGKTFKRANGISAKNAYAVTGIAGSTDAGDPNGKVLFASTDAGLYMSNNAGKDWTRIKNFPAIPANLTQIKLALSTPAEGKAPVIYATVVANGKVTRIYRSADLGKTWLSLILPSEDTGQGQNHVSFLVDPKNPNRVFMGVNGVEVYRGIFTPGAGGRGGAIAWALIGTGGTNTSGPNDDSRNLAFDARGNLIEVDDGGIYKRSNPSGNGPWSALVGNLSDAELHNVTFNPATRTILGGAQDDGDPGSLNPNNTAWADQAIDGGDGGQVQAGPGGMSYVSRQNLKDFVRRLKFGKAQRIQALVTTAAGRATRVPLLDYIALPRVQDAMPFNTPFRLNNVDPRRLIIGAKYLYESTDYGDHVRVLSRHSFGETTTLAYGGMAPLRNNGEHKDPGVLYVGTDNAASYLVLRAGATAPLRVVTSYPGTSPRQIVLDPNNWRTAFIVDDANRVWMTKNAGAPGSWANLTGNLADAFLQTLTVIPAPGNTGTYALLAGGIDNVYRMLSTEPGVWGVLGGGLPRVPVYELAYSSVNKNDVLVAGTLGRGAWTINSIAANADLYNNAPTISGIGPQGVAINSTSSAIPFTVASTSTPTRDLVVTAASSNPNLIPNTNITLGGTGANRTIRFTPLATAKGSATITITVSDGTSTSFRTFPVVVAPVGAGLTLFPMASQSIQQDTSTTPNPFVIANAPNPGAVAYRATSSNTDLVPNGGIRIDRVARTIRVTPNAGQSGTATITLTAQQGNQTSTKSFTVTVNPNPAPAVIAPLRDQRARAGAALNVPLSITLPKGGGDFISDPPEDARSFQFEGLVLFVQSSNTRLLPTDNMTVAENDEGGFTLTATPNARQAGVTTVTIGADNGQFTVTRRFKITVRRGAQGPVRASIAAAVPGGPAGARFHH